MLYKQVNKQVKQERIQPSYSSQLRPKHNNLTRWGKLHKPAEEVSGRGWGGWERVVWVGDWRIAQTAQTLRILQFTGGPRRVNQWYCFSSHINNEEKLSAEEKLLRPTGGSFGSLGLAPRLGKRVGMGSTSVTYSQAVWMCTSFELKLH